MCHRLPQMPQDATVLATGLLQSIGKDGQIDKGAKRLDTFGDPTNGPAIPFQPGRVEDYLTQGRAIHVHVATLDASAHGETSRACAQATEDDSR